MMGLTEKVKALAEARKRAKTLDAILDDRRKLAFEEFKAENRKVMEDLEVAAKALAELEAEVRADAVAAFGATGEKNPAPGVSVVVSTKYDYTADEALKWAMNHNTALTLDKKAFGEVCKSDRLRPEFVTVMQEPSARIATDLERALEVNYGNYIRKGRKEDQDEVWGTGAVREL